MQYNAVVCVLSAKYIHASLAPYCLLAGVKQLNSKINKDSGAINLNATVVESTVQKADDNKEEIVKDILKPNPVLVGFSCYIWNIEKTLEIAMLVKKHSPKTIVVLGGPEVSYCAKKILQENNFIDCILSGEAEESFAQLFLNVANNLSLQEVNINGLCTKIYIKDPAILSDNIVNPISEEYINAINGRIAYIETSRGCPYSCAFCLSGRCGKPRYFNLETVFENILKLANSGTKTIKFVDRTFNANTKHANSILQFVLDNYGKNIPKHVCFHFEIAADILKDETINILSKMPLGAVQLEIGMQSFNEKTLKAVYRTTNTQKVKQNITKLMNLGNIHIHIDLIAGLKYEDLHSFEKSFNTAYALNAHVLQLGFLKILKGSAISENPEEFECTYSQKPPYQVIDTPWLSQADIKTISFCENELERIYNSKRFKRTAKYAIKATGKTPFLFYSCLGKIAKESGLNAHGVSLDEYTHFLYTTLKNMPGINEHALRDEMVKDRLSTNSTGKLPAVLHVKDDNLGKVIKALNLNKNTMKLPNIKRGVAILYACKKVCFVNYTQKNPITHEYILHELNIDNVL